MNNSVSQSRFADNAILLERASQGDRTAEEIIIKDNIGLIRSIAVRFIGRGQDIEDLIQIGSMGMLKAIRGYDKKYNTAFSTYAVPLITGEIKRFLRDDGLIKVSRETKRNYRTLMKAKQEYVNKYGTEPKISELCNFCGIDQGDASYAISACSKVFSLQEKIDEDGNISVEEICADERIGDITEKIALMEALDALDKNERNLIVMRYFKDLTQNEVAKIMGMTQVKVSRKEKKIMEKLKGMLEGL